MTWAGNHQLDFDHRQPISWNNDGWSCWPGSTIVISQKWDDFKRSGKMDLMTQVTEIYHVNCDDECCLHFHLGNILWKRHESKANANSLSIIASRTAGLTMVETVDLGQPSLIRKSGVLWIEQHGGASTGAAEVSIDDLYQPSDPNNRYWYIFSQGLWIFTDNVNCAENCSYVVIYRIL